MAKGTQFISLVSDSRAVLKLCHDSIHQDTRDFGHYLDQLAAKFSHRQKDFDSAYLLEKFIQKVQNKTIQLLEELLRNFRTTLRLLDVHFLRQYSP